MGITATPKIFEKLANHNLKVLVLGYKCHGRGVTYEAFDDFEGLNKNIYKNTLVIDILKEEFNNIGYKIIGAEIRYPIIGRTLFFIDNLLLNDKFQVVSFDNLAVSQLKLDEHCSQENWETLYMGDDGEMTMYVDLVKGECARSSISTERHPIKDNIAEMFKSIRK